MLPSLPPPPPPPTPPGDPPQSAAGDGLNPSLLIISAIILLVAVASASIHLLLRFLSRRQLHSPPPPLILHHSLSYSSSSSGAAASGNQTALINSLPLFSLASSLAALPKSSPDCAVCLSRFEPHDQLRLLPACRHAFHSACIDTWLRSSRSCPLCRDPILLNPPPAPPSDRSGSFRLEIGSVSRRRTTEEGHGLPPHARSYSIGSSFDYVVEEEVEAVVAAVAAHVRRTSEKDAALAAAAPGEEVAEAAGGGGRGWLKEYVDRMASSASSSFSSFRCSGRLSRRSDAGCGGSLDLEGNPYRMEEDSVYSFYRWLTGM